jgi:fido (protein-threonine AMPylation protein)
VLCNLPGITRVRDMNEAESRALLLAQDAALDLYGPRHRINAGDVTALHRLWLGPIYPWAGEYRTVNVGKAGFQFAHAQSIPSRMAALERGALLTAGSTARGHSRARRDLTGLGHEAARVQISDIPRQRPGQRPPGPSGAWPRVPGGAQ